MLILAEGILRGPLSGEQSRSMSAWLGPMVDAGTLHSGYVDAAANRVWLILSAVDTTSVDLRLGDLPMVRSGTVAFATRPVTALRFT